MKKFLTFMAALVASVIVTQANPAFDCSNSLWWKQGSSDSLYVHQTGQVAGINGYGSMQVDRWNGSSWVFVENDYFTTGTSGSAAALVTSGYNYRLSIYDGNSNFLTFLYTFWFDESTSGHRFEDSGANFLCN
jgi:hypothetical protein